MTTVQLLPFGLALHLAGITMMVGTFLAGYLNSRQLWRFLPDERDKALVVSRITSKYALLQMIGGSFILLGGIGMMVAVHGVFMRQGWFQVKMILLALLIVNAAVIARPAAKKLRRMLARQDNMIDVFVLAMTRRRLMVFYGLQLALFLTIFVLSAFKFN